MKIGKNVFLSFPIFREHDLVEIGDNAAVNVGAVLRTHTLENWILKMGPVTIGRGACVGMLCELMTGSVTGDGVEIASNSLVMKDVHVTNRGQVLSGSPLRT